MARNAVFTATTKRKAAVTHSTKKRYSGPDLQTALGASAATPIYESGPSPLDFVALRQELESRLRSTGGRPGLADVEPRKIPVTSSVWKVLTQAARHMSNPSFRPTAAHVASLILTNAVRTMPDGFLSEIEDALRASSSLETGHQARPE